MRYRATSTRPIQGLAISSLTLVFLDALVGTAKFLQKKGVTMKKCMRTLAILAVVVPGLAYAGEPVPMTDSDLDSVAAGLSLKSLSKYTPEQILAHPRYSELSAKAIARYEGLNDAQKSQVAARVAQSWPTLSAENQEKLRTVTPSQLRHLLPSAQ